MIEEISSAAAWGRFGLAGLVIAALFAQMRSFIAAIKTKDTEHKEFISHILDEDRNERQLDRKEHRETTNKLSDAINDLTIELKSRN